MDFLYGHHHFPSVPKQASLLHFQTGKDLWRRSNRPIGERQQQQQFCYLNKMQPANGQHRRYRNSGYESTNPTKTGGSYRQMLVAEPPTGFLALQITPMLKWFPVPNPTSHQLPLQCPSNHFIAEICDGLYYLWAVAGYRVASVVIYNSDQCRYSGRPWSLFTAFGNMIKYWKLERLYLALRSHWLSNRTDISLTSIIFKNKNNGEFL